VQDLTPASASPLLADPAASPATGDSGSSSGTTRAPASRSAPTQHRHPGLPIPVVLDDRLAPITPRRDVMQRPRPLHPQRPRHRSPFPFLSATRQSVKLWRYVGMQDARPDPGFLDPGFLRGKGKCARCEVQGPGFPAFPGSGFSTPASLRPGPEKTSDSRRREQELISFCCVIGQLPAS